MKSTYAMTMLAAIGLIGSACQAFAVDGNENLTQPPDVGVRSERDRKVRVLCETLKNMGRGDVAQALQRDYDAGIVRLITFPSDSSGTTAETRHNGIVLNEATLGLIHTTSPKTGRVIDKGLGVSGALTVLHEYVHYNESQAIYAKTRNPLDFSGYQPDQISKWENKAWTQTIVETRKWADKLNSDIANIDNQGLSAQQKQERLAILKELSAELLGQAAALREGLASEIRAGHVDGDFYAHGGKPQADLNVILDEMSLTSQDVIAKIDADLASNGKAPPVEPPGLGTSVASGLQTIKDAAAQAGGAIKDGYDKYQAKKANAEPAQVAPDKQAPEKGSKSAIAGTKATASSGQAVNPDMQGNFSGSVKMPDGKSTGALNIAVEGDRLTGSFTENFTSATGGTRISRRVNATVSGRVNLASGAVEMQATGSISATATVAPMKGMKPIPPATNTMPGTWTFCGSYTGSGFAGSTDMPWSVARSSGASNTKSQSVAVPAAGAQQPDVPNKGGTITGPYGERTVLTYRQDATGKMVPVTTEYDLNGRQVSQTTVDSKGQTVKTLSTKITK